MDEVRIWVRSSRVADGTPERPFFLRVRLASAAIPFADPANTWHRLVPVPERNAWCMARFSLSDLPPAIRSAVNAIDIEWRGEPGQCEIDTLLAVREQMILDVESALSAALGQLTEGGSPVPVAVAHPGATLPALPHFRLTAWSVQPRPAAYLNSVPCDFTDQGFRLRPPAASFDLFYDVDAAAATHETRARLLEFALGALAPTGELFVNRIALPIELLAADSDEETTRAPLRFRISNWQSRPAPERPVRHVTTVDIETDSAQGRV